MALDRTRYMQSSKTFVMVDRPFWKDTRPAHRPRPDEHDADRPADPRHLSVRQRRRTSRAVICLSYSWMSDALKMLPLPVDERVRAGARPLKQDLPEARHRAAHHRRPDHRLVGGGPELPRRLQGRAARPLPLQPPHVLPLHAGPSCRRSSAASSWPATTSAGRPAWVEGAVQTALNAVWGILHHLGGRADRRNPGPGDRFEELKPLALPE